MKAVYIVWEDAACIEMGPWAAKTDYTYEPVYAHSVGFVLYEDDKGIILTDTHTEDLTGPVQQIPKGMIREMYEFKRKGN